MHNKIKFKQTSKEISLNMFYCCPLRSIARVFSPIMKDKQTLSDILVLSDGKMKHSIRCRATVIEPYASSKAPYTKLPDHRYPYPSKPAQKD